MAGLAVQNVGYQDLSLLQFSSLSQLLTQTTKSGAQLLVACGTTEGHDTP